MLELHNKLEECTVCRQEYTSVHAEAMPGVHIYICESCLEAAKFNFIFICMGCGRVYIRPKAEMIRRLRDPELRRAYTEHMNESIIQGIDRCINCDPAGILNYVMPTAMDC